MFEFQFTIIEFILLIIFAVSVLVQLSYYLIFYRRTGVYRQEKRKSQKRPVSVIICARNEAENLEIFLPSVLEQDYPDFEVIVVNDCSEDDTEDILEKYARQYDKLKITKIHKESSLRHSKKMALFLGIKAAKNELLLLTDADCQPVSANWISSFASSFAGSVDFVLGYGGYLKQKGLLNKYVRWDTMFIAMQYAGMAMAGLPYMGVGRNLAYRKSVFFNNKGFGPNLYLQSGDDDLFVNLLAVKKNTRVNLAPESFTRSIPAKTWKEFRMQKTRHLSTASHYKRLTKFLLLAEPGARVLFYSLLPILLILTGHYIALGMAAAAVIICKIIIYALVQNNLNEKDLLVFSLLFDIISLFLNVYFLLNVACKRHPYYEWK
ncbi:MAG: glycosyltransferase [Bacteroidales bacterium]|nr:glycosyltransferase [Bacteroidales bacterium]